MILLTGATGFIGAHLFKELCSRFGKTNVIAFSSKPVPDGNFLLHQHYKFERDYLTKNGVFPDVVIHAGAYIPKSANSVDWQQCNANIHNTEKLLTLEMPALKKLIFLSTVDVYQPDEFISENSAICPVSLYGLSKYYTEKIIEQWAVREHKLFQNLRVGHVYGPGEEQYEKLIPITMRSILRGMSPKIFGRGDNVCSFVYIGDVVDAITKSVELDFNNGPINVVSENNTTTLSIVNEIIAISGADILPEFTAVNRLSRNLRFDNSKMKEYLGSEKTSLKDGLESEWQHMKKLFEHADLF